MRCEHRIVAIDALRRLDDHELPVALGKRLLVMTDVDAGHASFVHRSAVMGTRYLERFRRVRVCVLRTRDSVNLVSARKSRLRCVRGRTQRGAIRCAQLNSGGPAFDAGGHAEAGWAGADGAGGAAGAAAASGAGAPARPCAAPFLNSVWAWPRDRASCGILAPPKTTRITTRTMRSSGTPTPTAPAYPAVRSRGRRGGARRARPSPPRACGRGRDARRGGG